ncbi:hypothetical protein I7I50_03429 [Histoplasma capsulatum G186AR]|uniref:Uncharacterized protein n=1 Tax=Ajellomyces capsulatus TaxID=5037 RepID=A0A8H7YNF5_AJECA|nr:hypothetical protein I7I52_04336 [Histoplasma capsulatum]QSS74578.1 hypothetical protein I7I50_03429 [Histoplasma capsulatum G186AR]
MGIFLRIPKRTYGCVVRFVLVGRIEEGVRFKRLCVFKRVGWDRVRGIVRFRERVTVRHDIDVRGAPAFRGDDVRVVGKGDFVDNTDERFVPCLVRSVDRGLVVISVFRSRHARFKVGEARKVKCEAEARDVNIQLRDRQNTAGFAE